MPSNNKSWQSVERPNFENLARNLRAKGFIPPFSDSGLLRGPNGFLADVSFNEGTQSLAFRVRDAGKGQTFGSFFAMMSDQLSRVAPNATPGDQPNSTPNTGRRGK
jgi:hypothetical protein